MNSVRVDPRVTAVGAFYGISRIGVGRITLNPADNFPTALAMSTDPDAPVNVSYGLVSVPVNSSQQLMKTVRVVNKENVARTFSVSFTNWATTPGATYSLPDGASVNLPANGTANIRVQLDMVGSQLRHSRDTQAAATQGTNARELRFRSSRPPPVHGSRRLRPQHASFRPQRGPADLCFDRDAAALNTNPSQNDHARGHRH